MMVKFDILWLPKTSPPYYYQAICTGCRPAEIVINYCLLLCMLLVFNLNLYPYLAKTSMLLKLITLDHIAIFSQKYAVLNVGYA